MDIRIDGEYERVLLKLAERNHEPTATGMMRILIREAAKESGDWNAGEVRREEAAKVNGNG